MSAAPRLVVFDVDGTLVDSQRQIHATMTRAFASAGRPEPGLAEVLSIVGLSLPEAVARLLPGAERDEVVAIVAAYRAGFGLTRAADPAPLYPGAAEAVRALSREPGLRLGVATGKSRRGLDHMLAAHGLAAHFVTRQVADDHPSKPHPSMLRAALAETGAEPAQAVMIGDTTYDMDMAAAAGMPALGVAWGYHPAEALERAGAARVIESFAALPAALEAIWGGMR